MPQSLRRKVTTLLSRPDCDVTNHPSLKLVHGRPNIRLVLYDEIAACTDGGSISVDGQHPSDDPHMDELTIAPDSCWTSEFDGSRATCPLL